MKKLKNESYQPKLVPDPKYNFPRSLCYHVVAYSHIKRYHWFDAEYRQSDNFVRKTKKGAHVKETKSAAGRHKKITTDLNY